MCIRDRDNPGIDIRIKAGTKGETVYIPVIVTQAGLKDVVYNKMCIRDRPVAIPLLVIPACRRTRCFT